MIKYFMRPDSNEPHAYSYVVGEDTDYLWDSETCIEVDPQPTINHIYNMISEAWELSEVAYMSDLRSKRDLELVRVDRYVLSDYPITEENRAILVVYRQALRDAPNQELLVNRVLPECPQVCQ